MNNLLMGRLSNLQPAVPNAYLDLDFSKGSVPAGLVYSRASNHGVWDKDGKYSVVGPNVPPITWVPEVQSWALAQEPFSVLKNRLYPEHENVWMRTVGFMLAAGGDIPTLLESTTLVDAPDGTMTAVRLIGTRTAGMGPIFQYTAGATSFRAKLFIRPIPGVSPPLFKVMFRNGTSGTNFPVVYVNAATLEVTNPDPSGQYLRVTRRGKGWLEIDAARVSGIAVGEVAQVYFPDTGNGNISWDVWRVNVTDGHYISSYIEPGTTNTYAARSPYNSITPLILPESAKNEFDWFGVGMLMSHPYAIINGSLPWVVSTAIGRRVDVNTSTSDFHGVAHLNKDGVRENVALKPDTGVFGGGVREIRWAVRSGSGTSYAACSGGGVGSIVTYPDMSETPEITRFRLGEYNPNVLSTYLIRTMVMPLGTISNPTSNLVTASMR